MPAFGLCPICGRGPRQVPEQVGEVIVVDCNNCGDYAITMSAMAELKSRQGDPTRSALLAHLVRRRERSNGRAKVDSRLVEHAFSDGAKFPTALEQVENLLFWFAEAVPFPGRPADIVFDKFQAVIGCTDGHTYRWVVESAINRGLIAGAQSKSMSSYEVHQASLTLDGWDWYDRQGRHKRGRRAFMAMKYGVVELDRIVNDFFVPAVAMAGFDLRRLDSAPEAGSIDARLRVEIRRSRLLICDLTHDNLGAYFEAGFAEGIGIPVIYTCEAHRLKDVHFDTRNSLIVPWTADAPGRAADSLKATIRNTLPQEATLDDPKP